MTPKPGAAVAWPDLLGVLCWMKIMGHHGTVKSLLFRRKALKYPTICSGGS